MGLRTCFRANREDWWTNRGPFWFTRINKRLRVVDGGLLGTKGRRRRRRRINGETGGRCPGTGGSRVVYLDTDAKTNGTIKLNSSQTPVARSLLPSLASTDSPALDPDPAILRVYTFRHWPQFRGRYWIGIDPNFPWFIYFDRDDNIGPRLWKDTRGIGNSRGLERF